MRTETCKYAAQKFRCFTTNTTVLVQLTVLDDGIIDDDDDDHCAVLGPWYAGCCYLLAMQLASAHT